MNDGQEAARLRDLVFNKTDPRQREFLTPGVSVALQEGQARLAIDKFALTANNITYALVGDGMQYWNFFPVEKEGYGRVPVWGFADIAESRCDEIAAGERVYGFFPISRELIVSPIAVSATGFMDGVEHRKELHPIYNQYTRTSGDPSYSKALEAQQMILRPLFMTSFLIEDFLRDQAYFSADRIIITSASSKTAIGTACQIAHSNSRPAELLGVTSQRNAKFVESLGLYDSVVTYDEIESLDPAITSVIVDLAGNGEVLQQLHATLDQNLQYSCRVGVSHWDANTATKTLAGPKPNWFFAPAQFQKRAAETGTAALLMEFADAWIGFVKSTSNWMEIIERHGEAAIQQTVADLLDGNAEPSSAFVLTF